MAAVIWNHNLNAGQDWLADINLLNTDGSTRNIEDHTLESQVRRHYKSVNSKTSVNLKIVNDTLGNIQLSLTNAQTTLLKTGKYVYDVELIDRRGAKVEIVGDGADAKAVSSVNADGTVSSITIINGGSGYTSANITITDSASTPTGSGATATAIITDGSITGITITNGGSNYVVEPRERVIEGVITIKPEATR